jgi:transposase-like protein
LSRIQGRSCKTVLEGLSLKTIGNKFGVSKEAVRQWILKFEEAFASKPLSTMKERPLILLMDETKGEERREGAHALLCPSVCLDLSRREVIATKAFRSRSSFSTIAVMEQALKLCESKPIVMVDHAPRYKWTFEGWYNGEIPWIQITHGLRNYIERWYLTFKERTKRFYNNFPIKDPNQALERISKFMHLFAYWYNRMPPTRDSTMRLRLAYLDGAPVATRTFLLLRMMNTVS